MKLGKSHGARTLFFYNPSWNLLGDFNGSPGTYYHGSPGYLSRFWNLLDQVILRPEIAGRLEKSSLAIITSAGGKSLVGPDGRPNCCDHLPLTFALNLE